MSADPRNGAMLMTEADSQAILDHLKTAIALLKRWAYPSGNVPWEETKAFLLSDVAAALRAHPQPSELEKLVQRMREEDAGRDYYGVAWVEQVEAALRAWRPPQPQEKDQDSETRVGPLTAGDDGLDLPRTPSPGEVTAAERTEPPQHIIDLAIEVSRWSPCQSKRGVVIFTGDNVLSHGHNFKPRGFECDGSLACKSTCRVEAVHAEQNALIAAGGYPHTNGANLLHVKSVDGQLVASGGPSCVECSKLALSCGIAGVWLYQADGWHRYEAADFHQRSINASQAAGRGAPPPNPQEQP